MTAFAERAAGFETIPTAELIDDAAALEPWRAGWDRLAQVRRRPFCAPAWMLAWWRHGARPGCRLRTVVVHQDRELLGIAPFFVERTKAGLARYRILAAPWCHGAEPLAAPGCEREVGALFARALAGADPPPDELVFEALREESPWPEILREEWPTTRPPWLHRDRSMPAPVLAFDAPSFDAWFAGQSANFRQQMRRSRRKLEREGAVFAVAETDAEIQQGIEAFRTVLRQKWGVERGRDVLSAWIDPMLAEVARELAGERRFRLWTIQRDGQPIAAHVFVAAGGEVSYWLGGYDKGWSAQRPSLLAILAAIEDAWQAGDRRLDLGGGAQAYKYRFASGADTLAWTTLVPRGPRHWRTRLALAPRHTYAAIARRLSAETKERIRGWKG